MSSPSTAVARPVTSVATGGNSPDPRHPSGVATVAEVAAAIGDGGGRARASEPFAWLWARRCAAGELAELEAGAATLPAPVAAARHGAGRQALERFAGQVER